MAVRRLGARRHSAACMVVKSLGTDAASSTIIQVALGVALLIAAVGLAVRAYMRLLERARRRDGRGEPAAAGPSAGGAAQAPDDPGRARSAGSSSG